MRYRVWQIQDDLKGCSEVKRRLSNESDPVLLAHLVSLVWGRGAWSHVCNIEAANPDEVFEIGNIGPEDRIERVWTKRGMHSISVGDVITYDGCDHPLVVSYDEV